MRFDTILGRLCDSGADFNFGTKPQEEKQNGVLVIVQIRVYDDYDKIIWNSTPIVSLADCQTEWEAMQKAISDAETLEAERQADIEQGRLDYPDRITDANTVTLLELIERIIWLENELREMLGL
ncbi:unnamed protein product [marine sediment metagenome]|uniref:Uncharacterized protein n=1 Tax=marine sediment metagenome TaxID=412755 RepID=X1ECV4_9ZZZZ